MDHTFNFVKKSLSFPFSVTQWNIGSMSLLMKGLKGPNISTFLTQNWNFEGVLLKYWFQKFCKIQITNKLLVSY